MKNRSITHPTLRVVAGLALALALAGHTRQIRDWIHDVAVNGTGQVSVRNGHSVDVQLTAVVQTDDAPRPPSRWAAARGPMISRACPMSICLRVR